MSKAKKTTRVMLHAESADGKFDRDKFADKMADVALDLVNEERKRLGKPPLE